MMRSRIYDNRDGQYRIFAVDENSRVYLVAKRRFEVTARVAGAADSRRNAFKLAWVEDDGARIVAMYRNGERVGSFDQRESA